MRVSGPGMSVWMSTSPLTPLSDGHSAVNSCRDATSIALASPAAVRHVAVWRGSGFPTSGEGRPGPPGGGLAGGGEGRHAEAARRPDAGGGPVGGGAPLAVGHRRAAPLGEPLEAPLVDEV